jgi:hypothetical protein
VIIRQAKEQDATKVKESLIPWVSQPHFERRKNFSEEWLHEVGGHQQRARVRSCNRFLF